MKPIEKMYWMLVLVAAVGIGACNGANTNTNTNTNMNANTATPATTPTVARERSRSEYTEQEAREAREKAKGLGETIGDTLDDAWIHTKIVAQLIANTTTPERKINVDVVNNVVTLRGTVDTADERNTAERIAKETEGVRQVRNQLRVAPTAKGSPRG